MKKDEIESRHSICFKGNSSTRNANRRKEYKTWGEVEEIGGNVISAPLPNKQTQPFNRGKVQQTTESMPNGSLIVIVRN